MEPGPHRLSKPSATELQPSPADSLVCCVLLELTVRVRDAQSVDFSTQAMVPLLPPTLTSTSRHRLFQNASSGIADEQELTLRVFPLWEIRANMSQM